MKHFRKLCGLKIMAVMVLLLSSFKAPDFTLKLAKLKYAGGGNWYVSPTALHNLAVFCNQNINTNISPEEAVVEPGSPDLFNYPFVHMTGNGRFVFSNQEAENLRKYLIAGGFLNINDSYDMDKFVRPEMKKVFPELDFVELPFTHPIYHQRFNFPNGLPKIHEHNGKAPQGFGLIYQGRLVCFYEYESDIGDGWEDPEVHNDPPEMRQKALQMGANILQYVFSGQ
ncbi:MAG: DUF4159 domain-containing protein [Bacteroidetes bacterium]|jgi:hypothetical protein|nr:DUF4159 domain-containing protein [Bacteroidota bacterium]MBX7239099.1 DUF4159 domain-containing protein [Bacteroidia bacterium]MCW5920236.1 DUF4159 domain-containing protein [Bacteroidota bacterium]HMU76763.1 DUF4159 domain-containing protein [Bacteroidia bacterium]HMW10058.1 DUF4159 domain-containing protein [Bacteroidia bacterium]